MKDIKNPVYVTEPILPNMADLEQEIKEIFETKWITNHGVKHDLLENKLQKILKVPNVSIFNNGTIALLTALKALNLPIGSEVITSPFTFPATPHSISWNGLKPVFCDIEPYTMTIDTEKIESLITNNTSAILPVHVYGFPCDVENIDKIAKSYDLNVIYDAAHCFNTEINGKGIGKFGDISMFSFHATKLYNTFEGGCLTYNDHEMKKKIYYLRNFGIKNEEEIVDIGINGKMNEIQASIGLLNLKLFKNEQMKRSNIKKIYLDNLNEIEGIRIPKMPKNATDSFQFFPIVIEDNFSLSRDQLYEELKKHNIFTRKYFYPICSDYKPYKNIESSSVSNLPVANDIKKRVLCLPYFGDLDHEIVIRICKIIMRLNNQ
ncbi:MAG: DegT/DnrJ/EryC1/StrS family aminotransferase [Methanobacteriaceae archaeon]|nr:DegT/DnrJ/EryC1/StrS family aminotransferase [Methanobacteriaceae archaeon]